MQMSNKSKQTKSKRSKAPQAKGPVPKVSKKRSNNSKKSKFMTNLDCTLCNPGHPTPVCPFRVKYSSPLPPLKNSINFPNITSATAGMLVIFPQFGTKASTIPDNASRKLSAFIMSCTDSEVGTTPNFDSCATQTAASNSFTSVDASGGAFIDATTSIDNYRVWSSCLKVINTVQITSNQGQIAIVTDITPDQFLYGGSNNGVLTINDVFSMAQPSNTNRIGDEHCACFAPEEFPDGVLKTTSKGAFNLSNPSGATTPTINATVTASTESFEPKGIIIAIRNASQSQLTSLLIRQETLIEPIYAPSSGIVRQEREIQNHTADTAVGSLTRKSPDWKKMGAKALNMGAKAAGAYVQSNGPALLQRLLLGAML